MTDLIAKKATDEETEILLLTNFIEHEAYDLPNCVKSILEGQYENVLNNELSSDIIKLLSESDDFPKSICDNIKADATIADSWLHIGISSLLYFIQYNWTGPLTGEDIRWLKEKRAHALKELSLHDECNTNVKKPELLYFSKIIFSNQTLQNVRPSSLWWLFRTNLLHQYILNENSGVIFEETEELLPKISGLRVLEDAYCKTLFNVEAAQFYFYYRRTQNSEKYVENAQQSAKMKLNLEGALGKRTKYQLEEKAQLLLNVEMEKPHFSFKSCENVPKSIDLNDDVRLERIRFSEEKENVQLGSMEEAVILSKHIQLQLSQPVDKLTNEEIKPYLTAVIDSTKNWSIAFSSLYRRCTLESSDRRTVERAMMQMEYLLQELTSTKVPVSRRMDLFFASGLKSLWMLEETWADLMLTLGLVKGALDVFMKLELWEDVITCYNLLELKHKAAEVIRQELAKKPTVRLWCLLGDATQDPTHYQTAWDLSGQKSSRAQRHWGLFYYLKQNFEEAIPHLRLSVELNNIQENVWIRLGFAALQTEDWKLAATAYKSYCALEPSSFEAWNNLAKAYIKLGDKPKAWKSLHDAVKCNYDNWQIWDNLMAVSTDLGSFAEAIRCYHRIMDLKDHHLDTQILDILTNVIIRDMNDAEGNPSRKLLPKMLELFGRITSHIHNNPDVWRMYGQLTALKKTEIDDQKAAQFFQQAHRAAVSNPKWFQQEELTEKVLELCNLLAEVYLHCASDREITKKRSLLGSAKLSLQGVVKKVKEQQWTSDAIVTNLEKVEKHLNVIVDELEKIKLNS